MVTSNPEKPFPATAMKSKWDKSQQHQPQNGSKLGVGSHKHQWQIPSTPMRGNQN